MIAEIGKRDPLTEKIITCVYKVHSGLGPGFNEKIYNKALRLALDEKNIRYNVEKEYKVTYQGKKVGSFRADFVIEDKVIMEIKAVAGVMPKVFEAQVLSYLKAANYSVGLLVNFGNKSCHLRRLMIKSP